MKKLNKKVIYSIGGIAVILIAGILYAVSLNSKDSGSESKSAGTQQKAEVSESGDLIIPVSDVTEKATFYSYEATDGTNLEVIAVKADDGTIRTAFNTCQVCYDSGKGYYKQEGSELVCQNCGNRFSASEVEVTKGGCNPVPIFDDNKTTDGDNITISKDYLEKASVIFQNWK